MHESRMWARVVALCLPGSVSLSDDAVLLVRAAAGVSRRVQLDLRIGALPIPGAAGGALPFPGGIAVGGGAGLVVVGLVDAGIKVRVLTETLTRPGIAVSYDLVDVFAGAVGGAGIALAGAGAAGGGVVAVGGGNLQFNLFSLSAGKHLGPAQLVAGTYVLDGHHYLPQSTRFATACGAGGVGTAGDGGRVEPCGSGGTTIERIPLQVQPFFGAELRVGKASSLAADILASSRLRDTVGDHWLSAGSSEAARSRSPHTRLTRTVKPGYPQHQRRRPSQSPTLCLLRHGSKPGQASSRPRARGSRAQFVRFPLALSAAVEAD